MTGEDKIDQIINSQDFIAHCLRWEFPKNVARDGNKELDIATEIQFTDFKDDLIVYRQHIESKLGPPTYLEWDEYTSKTPKFAPMGYYIEWEIKDDVILCLFFGGDGNPEDPFMIIVGKTSRSKKSEHSPFEKIITDDSNLDSELNEL